MGLLTTDELGGLGRPGWYGTYAPARGFGEGVRALGGGGTARIKMGMIWSHRRPAGFWDSPRGRSWRRVSPGNMTGAMVRALLREIQAYEDSRRIAPGWRMTRPRGGSRPILRPRAAPSPSRPRPAPDPRGPPLTPEGRPRPRPRTGDMPVTTLASVIRATPRPVAGQRYARQARSGVPIRLATGGYTPSSYASFQK